MAKKKADAMVPRIKMNDDVSYPVVKDGKPLKHYGKVIAVDGETATLRCMGRQLQMPLNALVKWTKF